MRWGLFRRSYFSQGYQSEGERYRPTGDRTTLTPISQSGTLATTIWGHLTKDHIYIYIYI